MADQALTGIPAKFQHTGLGMPATDVGPRQARMPPLIFQNAFAQLRVQLPAIGPHV
jgi:hypothetical protein